MNGLAGNRGDLASVRIAGSLPMPSRTRTFSRMDDAPIRPQHIPAEPPEPLRRIWAPWRSVYFATIDAGGGCPFCGRERTTQNVERGTQNAESASDASPFSVPSSPFSSDDARDLVIHRGAHCYVLMNLYPYTNGHVMVIPYRHNGELADLSPEEIAEMWALAERSTRALTRAFKAQSFNLGMNLGRGAGAGVLGHLHLHVVPRWIGDTNFMTVSAGTRVISEALAETWATLRAAFDEVGA